MPASPLSSTTCPMLWWPGPSAAAGVHFFVPSDQRGQAAQCDDVEPGLRPTPVQDPIDLERLGQALERLRSERLTHKIAVDQVERSPR